MTGGKKTKILGDLTSIISALEVVLHEDALYKSTTLLYFTLYLYEGGRNQVSTSLGNSGLC